MKNIVKKLNIQSESKGFTFFQRKKADPLLQFSNKGFTLIEVLVTVAATGLLTVLATAIFINTVRNSKKAEITSEGRQNAALVIDRIQKDARGASSLSISGTDTLIINNAVGTITWRCNPEVAATSNGYISRQVGGSNLTVTNRDTVNGISINACSFSTPTPGDDIVSIDFTVNEGVKVQTGPQEYGVSLPFRTSVTARPNF